MRQHCLCFSSKKPNTSATKSIRDAVAALVVATVWAGSACAQSAAASAASAAVAPFDQMTSADLRSQLQTLRGQAESSPAGIGSVTLRKYPGHLTMLTVRLRSGGAELHEHTSDIFVVVDGEATEVIGGSIPDAKTSSPGEQRGARVVGGVEHVMRTGDIIHIAPGTPHQTLVATGKSFSYYVVKVDQP